METQIPLDKQAIDRFLNAVKFVLADAAVGGKAKLMLAGLFMLLLGANGMNVVNSYVGRDFMTAIADRDKPGFVLMALVYLLVFAGSTVVSVLARFLEESLGLLWRAFISERVIGRYLSEGIYYRLANKGELKNPDQRIAEDVRAFTVTTLSFVVILLNSGMTILAFSGVVWSISPVLYGVALVYAAFGSYMAFRLGRPLVKLNYDQLDKDASFRSTLLHTREHAEPILLAQREGRVQKRLLSRLGLLVDNYHRIIAVNRNLGFFTGGYYWLIGIIPALIVAPSYMAGDVEFGVVTQAGTAFSSLVGAFSLVVTQFQSISSFTAVISRLHALGEAVDPTPKPGRQTGEKPGIQISEESGRLAYAGLTLAAPAEEGCLLKDLTLDIPAKARVLVAGPDEAAGLALFKATAGAAVDGQGRIVRPPRAELCFLAEKPYLPHGTLREILVPSRREQTVGEEKLRELLRELALEDLPARAEGLDSEQDWGRLLTLAEQQLLAFIHVLLSEPAYVFLDRIDTALDGGQVRKILDMLAARGIGYVNFGAGGGADGLYDAVLETGADGEWHWKTAPPNPAA